MNSYTRRWHIWVCDDPSCHERHGEHQGEVHDVEVVPLSDAERMREALERIADPDWTDEKAIARARWERRISACSKSFSRVLTSAPG